LVFYAGNHSVGKSPEFKHTELKPDSGAAPARWPQPPAAKQLFLIDVTVGLRPHLHEHFDRHSCEL
jgi:hypothetical protein